AQCTRGSTRSRLYRQYYRGVSVAREMKDSGVAWVGAIPLAWKIQRLKDCAQVDLGKMLTPEPKSLNDELLPYMRATNISEGEILRSSLKEMWFSKAESRKLQLRNGDILVTEGGDIGRPLFVTGLLEDERIGFQNAANRIRWRSNAKFLYFWMSWMYDSGFHINNVNVVSISHLTKEKLEIVPIVIPPLAEQLAIADYIDQQTALIDQRLCTLEEKKTVLAELRKATIHEAVTKGLNKNAKMKESSIAWIGEVPAHWSVYTLKSVASVNDNVLSENISAESIIEYVDIGAVSADKGIEFTQSMTFIDAPSRARRLVKHGDVIISTVRTYLRAIAPVFQPPSNLVVSTGFAVIRARKKVISEFIRYSLQDESFMSEVTARSIGVSYPAINANELMSIQIVVPTVCEQRAIAAYLDQQTQHIDAQLATLDEQAQVLKELRKAIIHEAVTGKIDLSGVVSGKEKR
ncbi:MAG: restriction endonuclease subunit S, partial [Gallionella sp.]